METAEAHMQTDFLFACEFPKRQNRYHFWSTYFLFLKNQAKAANGFAAAEKRSLAQPSVTVILLTANKSMIHLQLSSEWVLCFSVWWFQCVVCSHLKASLGYLTSRFGMTFSRTELRCDSSCNFYLKFLERVNASLDFNNRVIYLDQCYFFKGFVSHNVTLWSHGGERRTTSSSIQSDKQAVSEISSFTNPYFLL